MNTDWSVGTISFFALDAFDVDNEFLSVHLDHFADGVALVVTTHNLYIT